MNVEELFTTMVDKRASHLHLVPGSPIMMRRGSVLEPLDGHILSPQDTRTISETVMSEDLLDEFDEKMETNFSFSVPGLSRFRIVCYQQRGSVGITMSTNPPAPPTMEDVKPPEVFIKALQNAPSGLFLLTGPRGSGKSHTLAAIVKHLLDNQNINIVSIEDPIDFLHKNRKGVISQREIGTDCLTYDAAFNSLPHQAPDIVVVTGVSEFNVIDKVLSLAAAGNKVICTAAAPNAIVFIDRMIELFPPHLHQQTRSLLSVVLKSAVAQTLLPRADGDGLVAAYEILVGIPQVQQAIRDGKIQALSGIMATGGREFGMSSQEMALRGLVKRNQITEEEAFRRATNPEALRKMMSLPY
jgi:twitching motility protein PilT